MFVDHSSGAAFMASLVLVVIMLRDAAAAKDVDANTENPEVALGCAYT